MKRLFLLLTTATIFTLSSCLKTENDEKKYDVDKEFGIRMFNSMHNQDRIITLDPAWVAFKFNVLWATAKLQGAVDLSNAYIRDPTGGSVGAGPQDISLQKYLFGDNTVVESPAGVFTISFDAGRYSSMTFDRNRRGKIIINTNAAGISLGGVLLEDMDESHRWEITFVGDDPNESVFGHTNYYRHIYQDSHNYLSFDRYHITRTSEGAWRISGVSKAYAQTSPGTVTNWEFDYIIKKSGTANHNYENVKNTVYTLWGKASGFPFMVQTKMHHTISSSDPLQIRAKCNPERSYGGKAVIEFDKDDFEADGDVAATDDIRIAKVNYQSASGDACRNYIQIVYNNKNFYPNESDIDYWERN